MPQFFSGLFPSKHIFLQNGQIYAVANNKTPADIAAQQAKYGQTPDEQVQLLMDFIFESGATNHTTVNRPTTAPAAAAPTP
jgi:hypothetical protein